MAVENILYDVSEALRVPVLVLALLALVVVVVEVGALLMELRRRRGRSVWALESAVEQARAQLYAGNSEAAYASLLTISRNREMEAALAGVLEQWGRPDAEARISKRLAEYDYRSLRRLERTRILVRMGPALGLMGTLIPLSPALAGLADGDVETLTENLRVAFSVTVAGLLVGAIAFAISLVRDRLYAQDYSDVEYVAATLVAPHDHGPPPAATHSHWAVAP
jgi:biopolymer transport protein ExbB/TolQ